MAPNSFLPWCESFRDIFRVVEIRHEIASKYLNLVQNVMKLVSSITTSSVSAADDSRPGLEK
jgi:hypothetical protein